MVVGNTVVRIDSRTGVSITIPVGAKTVLPNNTTKWDQREAEQRVSIIEAVTEADRQVKEVALQSFKDAGSFQHAVEARAHKVLWTENRQNIVERDINQQW